MKKYSPNTKQFYFNHMKSRYSLHKRKNVGIIKLMYVRDNVYKI